MRKLALFSPSAAAAARRFQLYITAHLTETRGGGVGGWGVQNVGIENVSWGLYTKEIDLCYFWVGGK